MIIFLSVVPVMFAGAQEAANQATKEKAEKKEITKKKKPRAPKLFKSHDLLELTITMDFKELKKDMNEKRGYHPGRLSYTDPVRGPQVLKVEIKARGKTRRNPRLCDMPPLMIKFDKEGAGDSIFRKQKKLKLVTHCNPVKSKYEQYVLAEYLVYRVYNLLTPKSFRVRLARVTYEDQKGKARGIQKFAFFIENEEKMAKRNNGTLDKTTMKYWFFQAKEEQIMLSVFQYLIGNTDWSIPGRHNVKLLRIGEKGRLYAVPYDFDMSGIVNTSYAKPHEKLQDKIRSVRSRWYRGLCRKKEEFGHIIAYFNKKKKEIYALYENCEFLTAGHRRSTIRYLDEFYDIIDNPRKVKKRLVENCKKQ